MNPEDNRELVVQIQRFTASSITMLNLLRDACLNDQGNVHRNDQVDLHRDARSQDRFMTASQKFIDSIKEQNDDFDYTRFIKKAFTVLRIDSAIVRLREKDSRLFNQRDSNNKIMTILPGIDLRFGYKFLNEDEQKLFWQYMYLLSGSVFRIMKIINPVKIERYQNVIDTLDFIESELAKTGVIFNNQIFNPFIGVGENREGYSVDEMFTGGELPKEHNVSIESVLNMLGVDKMIDEDKLNEQLKTIGEEQVNEATEKIAQMLGASDNPEVKEVCNTLIKDIVENLKENGINNIGDTLQKVAQNAKGNIEMNKMRKTASSMRDFMANGQERMKDMKDANGNPIGQQLMNSLSIPMSMMNTMNMNPPMDTDAVLDKDGDNKNLE